MNFSGFFQYNIYENERRKNLQNNFSQQPQYDFNYGMPVFTNYHEIIEKAKRNIRSHSLRVGFCILIFLASPYILGFALQFFGVYDLYLENTVFQYSIELLFSIVFLFLPFFVIYRNETQENKEKIEASFEKPASPMLFFTSVGFGLMLCYCGDFISTWISALFEEAGINLTTTAETEIPTSGIPLLLFAISTAVLPAIVEEFTMRAVTMQPLRKYGDKFAIIMTALVFGLMHRNAVQGIFAFIAGAVFGYIAIASGSIWTAVVVHSLNNGIYVVFNVLNERNPELFEKVYPIVLTAVFVIGLASAVPFILSSKRNKLTKAPVFPGVKKKTSYFLFTVPMVIAIVWMLIYTLFVQI